jgi:hypothetical protein
MRARPVRRNIYLPVVRFGVADSDWFSILLISCTGYLAPIPFGITILYVPLQMWAWLLATAGSIAFFNYIRIGRKPYWLQHKLKALFLHHRQYRSIPNRGKRSFKRAWIIDIETSKDSTGSALQRENVSYTTLLLEQNNHAQEVLEERWNTLSLTTN